MGGYARFALGLTVTVYSSMPCVYDTSIGCLISYYTESARDFLTLILFLIDVDCLLFVQGFDSSLGCIRINQRNQRVIYLYLMFFNN